MLARMRAEAIRPLMTCDTLLHAQTGFDLFGVHF